MNILVLTPIDPVTIIEVARICHKFAAHIFSPQEMALLAEQIKTPNLPTTLEYKSISMLFAKMFRANEKIAITKNKHYKHTIIFGNIDKDTKIKFHEIIKIDNLEKDIFDPYLEKMKEMYKDDKFKINWYTEKDANLTLVDFKQLQTFLNSIGIKEYTSDI